MKAISIFNDVLGPVMRGPSSSHTAASYHIGRLARALLGADVDTATFTFDPDGSYAQVYAQQGSDRAFAAGLMGWSITDDRFHQALDLAAARGIELALRGRAAAPRRPSQHRRDPHWNPRPGGPCASSPTRSAVGPWSSPGSTAGPCA